MDMIKNVIDLLNLDDFYGISEDIDFFMVLAKT